MREITREEANEIIKEASRGPRQQCTVAYGGKWYDIRGKSQEEVNAFISSLLGIPEAELPAKTMNIDVNLHQSHCRAGLGYVCSCMGPGMVITKDV